MDIEANLDLNVEVNAEVDLNAELNPEVEVEVEAEIGGDVQIEVDVSPDIEVELDANVEVEIDVQPEAVVEVEVDAPQVEIEVNVDGNAMVNGMKDFGAKTDAAFKDFGAKTDAAFKGGWESTVNVTKDFKSDIVFEVEVGGELNDPSEADCGWCCKQTMKAMGVCFGLSLSWVLISALFVFSFIVLLYGTLCCIALGGSITWASIGITGAQPPLWACLVFGIVVPLVLMASGAGCIYAMMKSRTKKNGKGVGMGHIFQVPAEYRFVDLHHGVGGAQAEINVQI